MFGQHLSDAALLDMMHKAANTCVAVMDLPDAERLTARDKSSVSPEQAACLSAFVATLAQDEAQRRGLI